jgi:hypothetical protein
MSDWKISVLMGQDAAGKWDAVAMPDKSIDEQKRLFKQIVLRGGAVEIGEGKKAKRVQLQKLVRLDGAAKRFRFDVSRKSQNTQPEIMA